MCARRVATRINKKDLKLKKVRRVHNSDKEKDGAENAEKELKICLIVNLNGSI